MSSLNFLISKLEALEARLRGAPVFRWGVIKSLNPLSIQLDASDKTLTGTVSDTIGALAAGERVLCLLQHRQVTVLARATGIIQDTGWHPLTLSTGWSAVSGHLPRARVKNGVLYLEGAVLRGAGGALTSLAVLPPAIRQHFTGSRTVFVGAFTAANGGSVAHGEIYLSTATGALGCSGYASLSGLAGWVVPITNTLLTDS